MKELKLCTPCLFGTESLVAEDLKSMGFQQVTSNNGRVDFLSDWHGVARANINSRFSEKVEIVIAEFTATSFEELYENTVKLPWSDFILPEEKFPVTGWSINSTLHSIPDCQKIIKKAIVNSLRAKYGISWFEESGNLKRINFSILKDKVTLMIDTSGEGLHKRGYRRNSNEAPIKETLAASLCAIARLKHYHTLYDPFCGSGTILIEGAMLANNIAPGIRRTFTCESWREIPDSAWREERTRALDLVKRDTDFLAFGSDISKESVELTLANAKKVGLDNKFNLMVADFSKFNPSTERGTLITNPPYGERIADTKVASELIRLMGKKFESKRGWSYNIISPSEDFEKLFGRKADKRRKLYNGMIRCQYYSYFK